MGLIGRSLASRRRRREHGRQDWRAVEFVVMDFETTGLDARTAAPLSVGWVVVRGGHAVVGDSGYRVIRYDGTLPTDAVAVHHLLPADLAGAPPAEQVGRDLAAALDGRTLVAHGVFMEVAMLAACGVRSGRRDSVDTIFLARSLMRLDTDVRDDGHALPEVAARLGVPVHRRHHAHGDALTTAGVFLALASRLEQRDSATLGDLLRLGRSR